MSDKKIIDMNSHEDPELEALYQQSKQTLPPEHLDSTIKQAAREIRTQKKVRSYPWFSGVAATVIVGVLVIQLYPISIQHQPDFTSPDHISPKKPEVSKSFEQLREREQVATDIQTEAASSSAKRQLASPPAARQKMMQSDFVQPMVTQSAPARSTAEISKSLSSMDDNATSDNEISAGFSMTKKQDTAEQMIERIEKYIDEAELDKAREELKLLRLRYPEFEIEPEIVKQLELP